MTFLTYQETGYTGADITHSAAVDNSISETFNKADGALGPTLTWSREAFTSQPFQWQVVSNQARYFTDDPGVWEDLQVPTPNVDTPNMQVSFTLTNLTRTGTGPYHISAGMVARAELIESGTYYRGYACEVNRNNTIFPGVDLWSIIIWRVVNSSTILLLASQALPLGDVTLPGTLTFTLIGSTLNATFTHAGSGPTMTATVIDATFTEGFVGLGGGNIIDGTDSGSVTIDNWSAVGDDALVLADPRGFLWVKNTDAASRTVTVSVNDRTFEQENPDVAVVVPSGSDRLIGPLTEGLAFTAGGSRVVAVNYSSVTNVSAAAVRVSNPPPDLP